MRLSPKVSVFVALVLFIVNVFIATHVGAQSKTKGNVIKINVLSPFASSINLQYERRITTGSSFQLGFYHAGFSINGTKFSGIGITPEYRFYLTKTAAPQGMFLAPFIRYQNFALSEAANKGTLTTVGGGLIIGKQWIFKDKVALDLFLGPKYSTRSISVASGTDSFTIGKGLSGFGVRAGVCLGLAF